MATNINSVVLTGNLVRDPELKDVGSTKILNISIAVNESVKKGDEWDSYANFFDITIFGKRAEALSKLLAKGKKIAVQGKLHQNRYEDKEGKKQSRIGIIADNIELLDSKGEGKSSSVASSGDDFSEDVPF